MAIDDRGNFIFGSILDEKGTRIFGNFTEYGYFAKNQLIVILTEAVHVAVSKGTTTLNRTLNETVHIADNILRSINRTLVEPVHVSISNLRTLTRTIATNVLLNVGRTTKLTREFVAEHVHVVDIFKRYFIYVLPDETVRITQSFGNIKFTRNILQHIHISDTMTRIFMVVFVVPIVVAVSCTRRQIKTLVENIHISIITSRRVTRIYTRTVKITQSMTATTLFVMKKMYSKVKGVYRGAVLKLQDGRDLR